MFLKSIKYTQYEKKPREWQIQEILLQDINLIVGKNSAGKTKTLNIINSLALLLSRATQLKFTSGDFEVEFDNNGEVVNYFLKYEESRVIKELLKIDGKEKLNRGRGGKGTIEAVEANIEMKFHTPENQIAAFVKRDDIQHPFLEKLFNWADSLILYRFGGTLGQDYYATFTNDEKFKKEIDPKQTNIVVGFLREGLDNWGNAFQEKIISDMAVIGYQIDHIGVDVSETVIIEQPIQTKVFSIYLKESDIEVQTTQGDISQGMFRAFSLIVQLNFAQMSHEPTCVLIDDIGEGLDFERSSALIRLLVEKAKESEFQLIMTTNDRFIMNNVPLEYWSIVDRDKSVLRYYNYANSKDVFENFELTGLNNFDFFSSGYYLQHSDK